MYELCDDGEHSAQDLLQDANDYITELIAKYMGKDAGAQGSVPDEETDLAPAPAVSGTKLELLPSRGPLGVCLHHTGFGQGPHAWIDVRGTGEAVGLPPPQPGCMWQMSVTVENEQEKTFVAQYNNATKETFEWKYVNDLVQLRLWKAAEVPEWESVLPEEERGFMIEDSVTGATAWRSEQRQAKMARGVRHVPAVRAGVPEEPPTLDLKLWLYQLERGPSLHLVWELVRITDALFSHIDDSGEMQSNFVKNGIDDWPKKAIAVGAEGGHFLRSAKGARLCAQAKGPCWNRKR